MQLGILNFRISRFAGALRISILNLVWLSRKFWLMSYWRETHDLWLNLIYILLLDCDVCLNLDLWLSQGLLNLVVKRLAKVIIVIIWLVVLKFCWSSCVDHHSWGWFGRWWVGRVWNWCAWFVLHIIVVMEHCVVLVVHLEWCLN